MARLQTFAKDIQLATAAIAPAAVSAALAAFAQQELAASIASGEGSPDYDRYVNGNLGAPESSVVPPGPILYVFNWWTDIVQYALQTLVQKSPVKSGDYQQSWIIRADGQQVSDPKNIGVASLVEITNVQPYHRKIDVGHMKMSVPHQLIETTRQQVMSVWGNMILAQRTMIMLPGGYILKGYFRRGIRPHSRTKLHKDTVAGQPMTYPTLSMRMRA
jgi:hypothetical protein